ncbi:MAG: hypothetical protein AAB431_02665 [Patescibacteria group bacterium]
MQEIVFTQGSLIGALMAQAGPVLFGTMLVLFGGALVISLLLKTSPKLFHLLVAFICILLCLWIGVISLDLAGASANATIGSLAQVSALLSIHRVLLVPIPFFLLLNALITLLVYGEKISDRHAQTYRHSVILSVWVSFILILLIGFESLI